MYPCSSDEDPTTTFGLPAPAAPPPARLGRRGRIAAIVAAAVVAAGAAVGVGMALGEPSDHAGAMNLTSHDTAPRTAGKHTRGDPAARQAWARQYGQDRSAMPNLPDVASASPQQQAAAVDLLTRTQAATAAYADPAKALAAGFDLQSALTRAEQRKPALAQLISQVDAGATPKRMPMLHVVNKANLHDGKVLDPSAPEALMYEYQGHNTWKLIGVMYVANEAFPQPPPDPGGPITRWHYHDKHGGASLMMHIFFVGGNDLVHAYALTMEGM
jgi:hypothetical protein